MSAPLVADRGSTMSAHVLLIEEKPLNVRLVKHFIAFSQ